MQVRLSDFRYSSQDASTTENVEYVGESAGVPVCLRQSDEAAVVEAVK